MQKLYRQDHNIQLSRYTEDNLKQLRKTLSNTKNNLVTDIVIKEEDILDWHYPVHIIDTYRTSEMKGAILIASCNIKKPKKQFHIPLLIKIPQ